MNINASDRYVLPLDNQVKINIPKIMGFFFIFICLTFIINGMLPQLQIALFSGFIKLKSVHLKYMLILLSIIVTIMHLNRRVYPKGYPLAAWLIFSCYTFIEIYILSNHLQINIRDMINGINFYYFFLLIAPSTLIFQRSVSEGFIRGVLIVVFIPLSILGIVQYQMDDPLLPVHSIDRSFEVYSWNYYQQVRAFSLFESGYSFGHFIALVGAIVVASPIKRTLKVPFVVLVIIAGYTTLTRNSYLEISAVLVSAILISSLPRKKKLANILTWIHIVFGLLVIMVIPTFVRKFAGKSTVFEDESFNMRIEEWTHAKTLWLDQDLFRALFGTGLVHNNDGTKISGGLIDNMFLAVGLQIGIIGLILWLILMIGLSIYVYKEAHMTRSPLAIGIAAYWTSWGLVSMFNISLTSYVVTFILLVASKKMHKIEKEVSNSKRNKQFKIDHKLTISVGCIVFGIVLLWML